ncbi:MAG: SDR family oxidoreductase [Paracoccaceae bacterium]|nr:SDR family oxidoreductase [Paracoccaceae bacterium]
MTRPKTPSFRLDGKRALVTGASSGIGQGCAIALGDAGAHVVCAARRADKLAETVEAIRAEGGSAEALALDQTDLEALKALLEGEAFDCVLNAAGLARHGPALETEPDDYDAVMSLNLRSAYFLSTWSAKAMIRDGLQGSIIHISSQMAHVGGQERAVYCASKHGVEGLTKAMAIEFGPHKVRINSICPTFILTDLTRPTFDDPEKRAWVESKIKLGRVGEIEDIMGAAVYLASEASSLVTGTSLLIDGGWTAD